MILCRLVWDEGEAIIQLTKPMDKNRFCKLIDKYKKIDDAYNVIDFVKYLNKKNIKCRLLSIMKYDF